MELQLGLALSLPVLHHRSPVKGLDVTKTGVMGLDIWSYGCCESKNKRSFDTAFNKIGNDDESKRLPLLLWHGLPDEEDDDDDDKRQKKTCSLIIK